MDMNTKDPEELRKEIDFYRSRLEAAEAKISLLTRGFSIEEKEKPSEQR